ncbi:uncharacterized protein LOC142225307 [Haematobia irritans]|uniref:uncharacterized protein LOC142225307 n=1 Tax=Haematobia irritans TaxID=7368 RepID=UPI003F4F7762
MARYSDFHCRKMLPTVVGGMAYAEEDDVGVIEKLNLFPSLVTPEYLRTIPDNMEENSTISRVAVKVPPFWKANPKLWFSQMESQFINAGISQDSTKYHTLVGSIESNILNTVSHIIENPPERDLYNSLKNALLAEFQDSEEKRLQKLMENVDLGDRKPSAMLRDMRQLASGKVSEEMLRSLWFQRLPATIKAVLSVSTDNLDKLSVMADKINDHLGNASINQVSKSDPVSRLDNLEGQINEIIRKFDELRTTQRNRSTSRKHRDKSPSPSVTDEGELKICRLMLRDQSSKQQFLVDTGADVSVIPASLYGKRGEVEAFELQAANRTPSSFFTC